MLALAPIKIGFALGQWYLFIGPPGEIIKKYTIPRKLAGDKNGVLNCEPQAAAASGPALSDARSRVPRGTGEKTASKEPILAERES